MPHPIRCSCGAVRGAFDSSSGPANRLVCYCKDCQSFAHFLKRPHDILDRYGGSEIVQTLPRSITFTAGVENLACMRLSEKGLMRWYARCCNTPIGNTLDNPQFAFVGLVHSCLDQDGQSLEMAFGPIRAVAFTKSAKGGNLKQKGLVGAVVRTAVMLARGRLNGSYRSTPFFKADLKTPIVQPQVLSPQEREQLRAAL
ncbi:MAG TPA: DUF6151 family protein [Dongiaceae bacterium]|nr:DUF6151 family protein [Dongiaceae bacterium]